MEYFPGRGSLGFPTVPLPPSPRTQSVSLVCSSKIHSISVERYAFNSSRISVQRQVRFATSNANIGWIPGASFPPIKFSPSKNTLGYGGKLIQEWAFALSKKKAISMHIIMILIMVWLRSMITSFNSADDDCWIREYYRSLAACAKLWLRRTFITRSKSVQALASGTLSRTASADEVRRLLRRWALGRMSDSIRFTSARLVIMTCRSVASKDRVGVCRIEPVIRLVF